MNISIDNFDRLCESTRNLEDQYNKYNTKCVKGRVTDIAIVSRDPLKVITCSQKSYIEEWSIDPLGSLEIDNDYEFDHINNETQMKQIVMSQNCKKFYILISYMKKEQIIVFENGKYLQEKSQIFQNENQVDGTIQLSDCGMYIYYFDGQGTLYKINDLFTSEYEIQNVSTSKPENGSKKQISNQSLGKRFLMIEDKNIIVSDIKGNLAVHKIRDKKIRYKDSHVYSEHSDLITYIQINLKKTKLVTCSKDGYIVIWKYPEMTSIHCIKAHKLQINQVKFHSNQNWIFSCSKDGTVKVWSLKTGDEIRQMRLEGHTDDVWDFEFLSDTKMVTCSSDKSIKLWDIDLYHDMIQKRIVLENYDQKQIIFDESKNNFIIAATHKETGKNNILKINIKTKDINIIYEGQQEIPRKLNTRKYIDELVFCTSKNIIKTINLKNNNEIIEKKIETESDIKSNIIIDEINNKLYVGLKNGIIECWDLNKNIKLFYIKAHKSKVRYLQITNDKKFIFSCGDDQIIKKWELSIQKEVEDTKMEGHNSIIYKIWLNRDETLLYSCSDDSNIKIWDLETYEEIEELCMEIDINESIYDMYVSNDESLLISCQKHSTKNLQTIGYWNLDTGKNINFKKIEYQDGELLQVIMDKEEKYLYAIFNDKILTYDYKYLQEIDKPLLFLLKNTFSNVKSNTRLQKQFLDYLDYQKNVYNFSQIPLIICCSGNLDLIAQYVIRFGVSNYSCNVIQTLIKSIQKLKKFKKKKKKLFSKQISSKQTLTNKISNGSLKNTLTSIKKKNKKGFIKLSSNEELVQNLKDSFKKIIATLSTEDIENAKITSFDINELLISGQYKDQTALIFLKYYKKLYTTVQTQLENKHYNTTEFNPRLSNEKNNYESLTDDSEFAREEDYYLYETQFGVDIRNGSMYSIRLFEILEDSNFEVMHTLVSIINIKWNNVYYRLLIQLFVYIFLTTFINAAYLWEDKKILFSLLSLPFLIALAFFEFLTFVTCGKKYFTFYNICDILIFGQLFLFVWLNQSSINSKGKHLFDIFTILISNLKFVLELRFFDELRYLIAMVLNVAKDVAGFTILACCFTYIYAAMIYGSDRYYQRPTEPFSKKIALAVDMALGSYEMNNDHWKALDWLIFIFSAITLTIVMLNLIIAIVGNTFNTYQEGKERFDLQEKIGMILDFDRFYYNFMKFKKVKVEDYQFYQILEKKNDEEDEKNLKLDKIIKKQEKILQNANKSFQDIQNNIDILKSQIDEQKKDFQGLKNIQQENQDLFEDSNRKLEKVHNHFFKPRASQQQQGSKLSMSRSSSFKPQQLYYNYYIFTRKLK